MFTAPAMVSAIKSFSLTGFIEDSETSNMRDQYGPSFSVGEEGSWPLASCRVGRRVDS